MGEVLRRARSARGLSLEQVANELRIEASQLKALEDERFEAIGPRVFVKGYLRHYCQLLGLDYGSVLELYQRSAGEPTDIALQPSRTIKLRNERQITLWIVAVLAVAIVAAALFFWWREEGMPSFDGVLRGNAAGAVAPVAVPDAGAPR